jgi:type I restriction enzyme S subunit
MNSKRRASTWGEEITLEYGKGLRTYSREAGDVPVFGTNGQIGWTDKALAAGPGIILGRKGAYRGIVFNKGPFYVIDTAYYVRPKSDLNMRWLYYAMIHHDLGSIDDGSPIPSTTRAAVYTRSVEIPERPEQDAIAKILGDIDDKIEIVHRMNKTLEAVATALFRAWFIEFEPVKAKISGATSYRGLKQSYFDRLPSAMVETTAESSYPLGWDLASLGQLIDINPKRDLKKGTFAPYVGMAEIPTEGSSIEKVAFREFTSGSRFQNGDTLIARITPCLENGKTALVDALKPGVIGWGSTEFIVLSPTKEVGSEFIYCLARENSFRNHAIKGMTGTSGRQRVSPDSIANFPIHRAAPEYYDGFHEVAFPLFSRIKTNSAEITSLSNIRDTLAPKLMSGQLTVPDLRALIDGL